jgi:hypothetical protein
MKTAVEWLVNQMKQRESQGLTLSMYELEMFAEQAKEMDKAERAKEYLNGFKDGKEYMKKYKLLN